MLSTETLTGIVGKQNQTWFKQARPESTSSFNSKKQVAGPRSISCSSDRLRIGGRSGQLRWYFC
jgi:hypothetical protein